MSLNITSFRTPIRNPVFSLWAIGSLSSHWSLRRSWSGAGMAPVVIIGRPLLRHHNTSIRESLKSFTQFHSWLNWFASIYFKLHVYSRTWICLSFRQNRGNGTRQGRENKIPLQININCGWIMDNPLRWNYFFEDFQNPHLRFTVTKFYQYRQFPFNPQPSASYSLMQPDTWNCHSHPTFAEEFCLVTVVFNLRPVYLLGQK